MCSCTTCEHTDGFRNAGFTSWPRGDITGKRKSNAEYAAHVKHGQQWGRRGDGTMHAPKEITASLYMPRQAPERLKIPGAEFSGMREYIAEFERLNSLKPAPVVKPTPRLIAYARELREQARRAA